MHYAPDIVNLDEHFSAVLRSRFENICDWQLVLFVPVGCHNGEVFMSSKEVVVESVCKHVVTSSHFALAVYSFRSNIVVYGDTLVWGMPKELKDVITKIRMICAQLTAQTRIHYKPLCVVLQ